MSTENSSVTIELQGIDKRHLAHVWEKMKRGQTLQGAETFIGRSLADHPQWYALFETIGLLETGDDTLPNGENPFAHIALHLIIASQIHTNQPEEAETFYRIRVRKGDSPHETIHMMIAVFQRHLSWAAQNRAPEEPIDLDLQAYGATLRSLFHLKKKALWARLGHRTPPPLHP